MINKLLNTKQLCFKMENNYAHIMHFAQKVSVKRNNRRSKQTFTFLSNTTTASFNTFLSLTLSRKKFHWSEYIFNLIIIIFDVRAVPSSVCAVLFPLQSEQNQARAINSDIVGGCGYINECAATLLGISTSFLFFLSFVWFWIKWEL